MSSQQDGSLLSTLSWKGSSEALREGQRRNGVNWGEVVLNFYLMEQTDGTGVNWATWAKCCLTKEGIVREVGWGIRWRGDKKGKSAGLASEFWR